jgi:hypothetical protein
VRDAIDPERTSRLPSFLRVNATSAYPPTPTVEADAPNRQPWAKRKVNMDLVEGFSLRWSLAARYVCPTNPCCRQVSGSPCPNKPSVACD